MYVVGDTIVDSYTRTSLIGGQTKTPTFSVLKEGLIITLEAQVLLLNISERQGQTLFLVLYWVKTH